MTGARKSVVYLAGSRWSDVPGTDRRLVTALGRMIPVLWVDPPFSALTRSRSGAAEHPRAGLDSVAPGVTRLQVVALPGASRAGLRTLADRSRARAIRSAVRAVGTEVLATIVASPRERFPRGVPGVRVLYVTDDWVAGAGMMALSASRIGRDLARNAKTADVAAAVSPALAEQLAHDLHRDVVVLANGCDPGDVGVPATPTGRAVLVGQLNDRLDLDLLEAVRRAGIPITAIGPRSPASAESAERLDRFLSSPGVEWRGSLPAAQLPAELATMGVGLTPYADTAFNRASFPLKTLEYLAAGLPVVSSDLPSVRWLDTDLIAVARNPAEFERRVAEALAGPNDSRERARRLAFAHTHSWRARAEQLTGLLQGGS